MEPFLHPVWWFNAPVRDIQLCFFRLNAVVGSHEVVVDGGQCNNSIVFGNNVEDPVAALNVQG